MDAVGVANWVGFLLRRQHLTLSDSVDRRMGILAVLRHVRDVDVGDRHPPRRSCCVYCDIEHLPVGPEIEGPLEIEQRERLFGAPDPVGIAPSFRTVFKQRKLVT